ncbi:MAG: 30S ribosomal protein S10 [Candidatus Aenigmarchaeota archaeon]|nr:30S ribosomal protein S10 [Candidatus Aenigmarchaeota archaeon]
MQKARIKLTGTDPKALNDICDQIKMIAEKFGASVRGPIYLPTKKLKVPVMKQKKTGTGHGNATWDRWELRIHKRMIEIGANQRALRYIMRINIPSDVNISIELTE